MLIKEYRIPMPLTVDEYRIAQLYMIQRKSREESDGEGSGVEILVNEPYSNQNVDGSTTRGQYTYKVYHIGKHLPSWFRSMVPQSAQRVEEEAWNAYPYTKTRYTCPFMEKFFIEIETKYFPDPGTQDNVFHLSPEELRQRTVEYIDIVKDSLLPPDSNPADDPAKYVSGKSGRGPLSKQWLREWAHDKPRSIMCAYKLCRIDFRYWGMQSKVEKFINDIGINVVNSIHIWCCCAALRKTMISAHQQAWCWQDEWIGLDMSDIRRLESEAQAALALKMKVAATGAAPAPSPSQGGSSNGAYESDDLHQGGGGGGGGEESEQEYEEDDQEEEGGGGRSKHETCSGVGRKGSCSSSEMVGAAGVRSRPSLHSMKQAVRASRDVVEDTSPRQPLEGLGGGGARVTSTSSLLGMLETGADSDEEDIEAEEEDEYLTPELPYNQAANFQGNNEGDTESLSLYFDANEGQAVRPELSSPPPCKETMTGVPPTAPCKTLALFIVIHGGNFLDSYGSENTSSTPNGPSEISGELTNRVSDVKVEEFEMRLNDINTFKATIRKVLKERYPQLTGRIAFKHVVLRDIYTQTLQLLTSLNPTGYLKLLDGLHHLTLPPMGFESPWATSNWAAQTECGLPLSAIPLLACSTTGNQTGRHFVHLARNLLNEAYHEFFEQEPDFKGQICLVSDMAGSIITYDVLNLSPPESSQRSQTEGLSFVPRHFFTLGSPLGLVLAQRLHFDQKLNELGNRFSIIPQIVSRGEGENVCQIYNMFYQVDPFAIRLEPFLDPDFGLIPPCPADGHLSGAHRNSTTYFTDFQGSADYNMSKCIHKNSHLLATAKYHLPKTSHTSSPISTKNETLPPSEIAKMLDNWWGNKRLDYVLRKCPSGLGNHFPVSILPHIFHAGYWQSRHVSRFILEQVFADMVTFQTDYNSLQLKPGYNLARPTFHSTGSPHFRDKWRQTKSSFVQNRNISSNHRANDVIINDTMPQTLLARFAYGPLDVITVGGQTVDVFVLDDESITSPHSPFAMPRKSLSSQFLIRDTLANTLAGVNATSHNYSDENLSKAIAQPNDFSAVRGKEKWVGKTTLQKVDDTSWKYLGSAVTLRNGRLQYTLRDEDKLPNGVYQIKMVVRSDTSSLYFDLAILPKGTELVVFSIDGSFTASVSLSGKDPKIRPGCLDVVRHWVSLGYFILYISARPDVQMNTVTSWMCDHNFPWGFIYFVDHFSADGLKNKAIYLKYLSHDVGLKIHSAYGSSKDIPIYGSIGLPPDRIYALGKVPKKLYPDATILVDGYVPHLLSLKSIGGSVPATGPGRIYHKKESLITHDLSKQQKFNLSPLDVETPSEYSHSIVASNRSSLRDKLWSGFRSSRRSAGSNNKKIFTFSCNNRNYSCRGNPSPQQPTTPPPLLHDQLLPERKHSLGRLFKRQ